MTSASTLTAPPLIHQVIGPSPEILAHILDNNTNLTVWNRQLPLHIADFAARLLSLDEPLSDVISFDISDDRSSVDLKCLASRFNDLEGYESFIVDIDWLVSAYACLLGAKRIGLRLRALDTAMCPRFHVDHVPVRLITTYAGAGSQWLRESVLERPQLGQLPTEPLHDSQIEHMDAGDVALLKGEKWQGNEGFGLIHCSPALSQGERRLILTLDWLA